MPTSTARAANCPYDRRLLGSSPPSGLFAATFASDRATQDFLGRGFLYGSMLWGAAYGSIAVVAIASRVYLGYAGKWDHRRRSRGPKVHHIRLSPCPGRTAPLRPAAVSRDIQAVRGSRRGKPPFNIQRLPVGLTRNSHGTALAMRVLRRLYLGLLPISESMVVTEFPRPQGDWEERLCHGTRLRQTDAASLRPRLQSVLSAFFARVWRKRETLIQASRRTEEISRWARLRPTSCAHFRFALRMRSSPTCAGESTPPNGLTVSRSRI